MHSTETTANGAHQYSPSKRIIHVFVVYSPLFSVHNVLCICACLYEMGTGWQIRGYMIASNWTRKHRHANTRIHRCRSYTNKSHMRPVGIALILLEGGIAMWTSERIIVRVTIRTYMQNSHLELYAHEMKIKSIRFSVKVRMGYLFALLWTHTHTQTNSVCNVLCINISSTLYEQIYMYKP